MLFPELGFCCLQTNHQMKYLIFKPELESKYDSVIQDSNVCNSVFLVMEMS